LQLKAEVVIAIDRAEAGALKETLIDDELAAGLVAVWPVEAETMHVGAVAADREPAQETDLLAQAGLEPWIQLLLPRIDRRNDDWYH
jgi:hypothetical protein